jgi:hypothetical protein
MRRVRKIVAQGEHARWPILGTKHYGDRFRGPYEIGEVLGSFDLDLKADGRVSSLWALPETCQRDGGHRAGRDGAQFPRLRGSQVIRRFDLLPETGPPRVDAHITPRARGSRRC